MVNSNQRGCDQELRELREVRNELYELDCSLKVKAVIVQLDSILGQIRDGLPVMREDFVSLLCTAEQAYTGNVGEGL